jgi:hypothetical protein
MYTSANRRHVNGLGVSGGVVCVLRMVPPFLNGCAVSVPRHALAMAHAIKGGKCTVWEKWPSGQPQAGGSEYLELHGAFSIALRAPGAALLSRFGFLAGRGARDIAFVFVVVGGDSPRFTQANWSWKWRIPMTTATRLAKKDKRLRMLHQCIGLFSSTENAGRIGSENATYVDQSHLLSLK